MSTDYLHALNKSFLTSPEGKEFIKRVFKDHPDIISHYDNLYSLNNETPIIPQQPSQAPTQQPQQPQQQQNQYYPNAPYPFNIFNL